MDASPPCRAIQMTAKALGIDVNVKELNVLEGEQFQPSFLKVSITYMFQNAVWVDEYLKAFI